MLKDYIESNLDNVSFYRDSFRRFIYIALALLVINFLLLAYLFYNQLNIVVAPNFASTSDGRLINIYPGDEITHAHQNPVQG